MDNYKVYENFLTGDLYLQIYEKLYSEHMAWFYYNTSVTDVTNDQFMFAHVMYNHGIGINSDLFPDLLPLITKSAAISEHSNLLRVKANLYTKTHKTVEYAVHEDFKNIDAYTTCVYNLDSNNGYTKLLINGKEKKIQRVANSLIVFNGKTLHCGATQTDSKTSILINLDFNTYGE